MITCKHCGYTGQYTDARCPCCSQKITLTQDEITERLFELDKAMKERRYAEAVEGYRVLAEMECTEAEKEYAKILEKGQLTPRNLDLAMQYFFRAAKKNDAYSAYRYSRLVSRENNEASRFWLIFSAILGCKEAYPSVAEEFSSRGYEEDAHYFYTLAATCDDSASIAALAKRYYEGIGTEQSDEYAKWYLDKFKIPPIYAVKLAYKLRHTAGKEPPMSMPNNYNGLLHTLAHQAKSSGFETAYFKISEILSDRGEIDSTAFVGEALIEGIGCKQDFTNGVKLLTKAAAKGSIRAHISLANLYFEGYHTDRNMSIAIDHYKRAGELGCVEAYEKLAEICYTGTGIDRNIAMAADFYTLAGKLGSAESRKKADRIVRERNEYYLLATEAEGNDPEEAFRLFTQAFSMGHIGASLKLAECLEYGRGTKKNRHGAFLLYKKAAESGVDAALLPLGLCYANGMGTRLNFSLAREILTRAERCGIEGAHSAIISIMEKKMALISARLYSTAMRLIHQKKFSIAKSYLELSKDLMYPKAIYTLGCLYEFGMGAPCDKDLAFEYYEKAYSLQFRDPRSVYKLSVLRMLKKGLSKNSF